MSTFARRVQAEQDAAATVRARNPKTPDQLKRWLRRNAHHVVGKLVEINAELKRMFGADARIQLRAFMPEPFVARYGGYVPKGVYFDLSVSLDGGLTGVGKSLFLEVADNRLHSPRYGWTFDADDPSGAESRAFLDHVETAIAQMLRHEARPKKRH